MSELPAAGEPIRFTLDWGRRYALWVFNFGLACCAVEFVAASMSRHNLARAGIDPNPAGPPKIDLLVVSGTVTDKMAPAIKRLYDEMPGPTYVMSFGACSNSGGPYWDSYSVTKGVDQLIPVDVYVPGCPPRPEALLRGIVRLQDRLAEQAAANPAADAEQAAAANPAADAGPRSTSRSDPTTLTTPLVRPPDGTA